MAAKTNDQLTADVKILTDKYNTVMGIITQMQQELDAKIKISDLSRSEQNTTAMLTEQAATLDRFETKLSKIALPDDPRMYLTQMDIKSFQTSLAKLLAMMTTFEQLYDNLVAYTANNLPTVQ